MVRIRPERYPSGHFDIPTDPFFEPTHEPTIDHPATSNITPAPLPISPAPKEHIDAILDEQIISTRDGGVQRFLSRLASHSTESSFLHPGRVGEDTGSRPPITRSTGAYKAASRLAIATPPPAYVLSRGIGWQVCGLPKRQKNERNIYVIKYVVFSGKFGAVFASIPFPIYAALYCVLFGLVGSVGLSFLQFTNMNSMRNLTITGLSLFLGLSVPQFFNEYQTLHRGLVRTNAGWFNAFMNTLFSSPPTVGLIVAVFLDNTLEVEKSMQDRGMPWWVKFRTFRGDNRNEEFYTLPFNLNRFFPPT
ncbi:Xanthine/uracil permease family protein [Actinidia rufa]|uniref:Xanthine/uracil permease family protein n=1 Tax=Actinidia rufa TaxID=165716 RepID=A0A7J0EHA8_9ERIC|nr:Xanthine/uracil permease family protein [Actinidia rufa]